MLEKVGRNDPCPCGSGLKYKKCCLPKDREKKKIERELIEKKESNYEDTDANSEVEAEEVSDKEAIRFYTSEFVQNGYSITPGLLCVFFEKCLNMDGYVDSKRVKEFCDYLRGKRRIAVTEEYINEYFDSIKF